MYNHDVSIYRSRSKVFIFPFGLTLLFIKVTKPAFRFKLSLVWIRSFFRNCVECLLKDFLPTVTCLLSYRVHFVNDSILFRDQTCLLLFLHFLILVKQLSCHFMSNNKDFIFNFRSFYFLVRVDLNKLWIFPTKCHVTSSGYRFFAWNLAWNSLVRQWIYL